ncbi:MAG TPA: hypothetical protein VK168_18970 [Saprospiraceae bacterium]|nr:hypothetical protein [Saprospiraceae bacterium]
MIQDHIPDKLRLEIAEYLRTKCNNSYSSSWRRNKSDEDSISAAFFQSLAKDKERMFADGKTWEWSIEYSTTSSRGPKPLETVIGADVIFFIEIILPNNNIYRKGILVQSKIKEKMIRNSLEKQIQDMEKFVPKCSVVLGYEENQFKSVIGVDYLKNKNKHWNSYSKTFCDFLADSFLECKYGVENLYYDFPQNEVRYDDFDKKMVLFVPERGATKVEIREL